MDDIEQRTQQAKAFFKKSNWTVIIVLALIVWFAIHIRTANLGGLKDITTNDWTLGPDLDPFLFLRWAKVIVAQGSIMSLDTMRYVPLSYGTSGELLGIPYLIAWFHPLASWFGSTSVTHSAVLFPALMFGLTIIAFFLFARRIFLESLGEKVASIIALIASFFLTVLPVILPRTVAGIPEKESAGFFFMFLAFYFFLVAWKSQKHSRSIFAILAGASTAAMALVWGGYVYIYATLGVTVFIAFLTGQVTSHKLLTYALWLFSAVLFVLPFTTRYTLRGLMLSTTTGIAFITLAIMLVHFLLFTTPLRSTIEKQPFLEKLPRELVSLMAALIFGGIAVSLFFGPATITSNISDVYRNLVSPIVDRLGVTVAENRQPFFPEWSSSFGPIYHGIPLFFWLFFFGSIILFYSMLHAFDRRARFMLTGSYLLFLLCIIFSRYKPESILNGTSGPSLFVYFTGFAVLFLSFGYFYTRAHQRKEEDKLRSLDAGLLLLLVFFFLSIISARGAVRIIMMLAPPASIIVSYFIVIGYIRVHAMKDETLKITAWIFIVLITISALYAASAFYQETTGTARAFVPSAYNQQWQKAMSWVRENTPNNAVFSHWWDYGYWLQSIGNRATVLDGGNAISYWDHLMGRHALTGTNNQKALEFLYSHTTTHFLIDSTDIGKYGAFSSIGSDENYDRSSFITTFGKDESRTTEGKNTTFFMYLGGAPLDEDILYDNNGTQVTLAAGKVVLAAITLEQNATGTIVSPPQGLFVHQNNPGKQVTLPLRYAAKDNASLIDFHSGLEAGIFVYPVLSQSGNSFSLDPNGALLYLSKRTVKSQLARLYLFKEDNPYFKLVRSEDNQIVAELRSQNAFPYDFVQFNGFHGPIRIWEIQYPSDMEVKQEYLQTTFPNDALRFTR